MTKKPSPEFEPGETLLDTHTFARYNIDRRIWLEDEWRYVISTDEEADDLNVRVFAEDVIEQNYEQIDRMSVDERVKKMVERIGEEDVEIKKMPGRNRIQLYLDESEMDEVETWGVCFYLRVSELTGMELHHGAQIDESE